MAATSLLNAVLEDDVAAARELLQSPAQRDAVDNLGRTPLILASIHGRREIVSLLLDAGADIDAEDIGGRTAFLWAAAEGQLEIMEDLLARDPTQVEACSKSGNTALHRAAAYGHEGAVSRLLAAGADKDCVNEEGATPLCRAARWGHEAAVRVLLDAGADGSLRDSSGRTAADWASAKRHADALAALAARGHTPQHARNGGVADAGSSMSYEESGGAVYEDVGADGGAPAEPGAPMRVEGWMAKQGHIIRNWKNRWFVLEGRRIHYYPREGAKAAKGSIYMAGGTDLLVEEHYSKPYCFTLITPSKKFVLQAANEQEMEEWIEAIQNNLECCPDEEDGGAGGGGGDDD